MESTISAPAQCRGGLNIPKIKKRTFKDSIQHVSQSNRDVQNLLKDVSKNCLDTNFIEEVDIISVFMVHNSDLQAQYVQKRTELKESGRNAQTLIDQLGFRMVTPPEKYHIAKEGLCATDMTFSKLGRGDCGVYLTRYFDVEVKYEWLRGDNSMDIFIFKYFSGKCKSFSLGNVYKKSAEIEPTPNYDSHVGSSLPNLSDGTYVQRIKSSVYLYEYTDECMPSKQPRHCLPYAIIKVRKKPHPHSRLVHAPRLVASVAANCETSDKPSSTEPSKMNVGSKNVSTKSVTPLLFTSDGDGKDSIKISCRDDALVSHKKTGEIGNIQSKENDKTVDQSDVKSKHMQTINGVLEGKLSLADKKTKLPLKGMKSQHMNISQSDLQNQYMKRFAAASEKIQAEKDSKMLECLKFILPPESEKSVATNNLTISHETKSISVALPSAESQNSKCSSSVVFDCQKSAYHSDRLNGRSHHANRLSLQASSSHNTISVKDSLLTASLDSRTHFSYVGSAARNIVPERSMSVNEDDHRNLDNAFCLNKLSVDPRLFKRCQSSSASISSNILASDKLATGRVEAKTFPVRSAFAMADNLKPVKRKMSYSEYKQLKGKQQQSNPVSDNNGSAVHEKVVTDSSSCLQHTGTQSKDDNSHSSRTFSPQKPQNVQKNKVEQQVQFPTTNVDDRVMKSGTEKTISTSISAASSYTENVAPFSSSELNICTEKVASRSVLAANTFTENVASASVTVTKKCPKKVGPASVSTVNGCPEKVSSASVPSASKCTEKVAPASVSTLSTHTENGASIVFAPENKRTEKVVSSSVQVKNKRTEKVASSSLSTERKHTEKVASASLSAENKCTEKVALSSMSAEKKHTEKVVSSSVPAERKHTEKVVSSSVPAERKHTEKFASSSVPKENKCTEKIPSSFLSTERKHTEKVASTSLSAENKFTEKVASSSIPAENKRTENVASSSVPAESKRTEKVASSSVPAEKKITEKVFSTSLSAEKKCAEKVASSSVPAEKKPNEKIASSSISAEKKHTEKVPSCSVPEENKRTEKIASSSLPTERKHTEKVASSSMPAEKKHTEKIVSSSVPAERKHTEKVPSCSLPEENKCTENIASSFLSKERKNNEKVATTSLSAENKFTEKVASSSIPAENKRTEKVASSSVPAENKRTEKVASSSVPTEKKITEKVFSTSLSAEKKCAAKVASSSVPADKKPNEKVASSSISAEKKHTEKVPSCSVPEENKRTENIASSSLPTERKHTEKVASSSVPAEKKHTEKIVSSSVPAERKHTEKVPSCSVPEENKRTEKIASSSLPTERKHTEKVASTSLPAENKRTKKIVSTSLSAENKCTEIASTSVSTSNKCTEKLSSTSVSASDKFTEKCSSTSVSASDKCTEKLSSTSVSASDKFTEKVASTSVIASNKHTETVALTSVAAVTKCTSQNNQQIVLPSAKRKQDLIPDCPGSHKATEMSLQGMAKMNYVNVPNVAESNIFNSFLMTSGERINGSTVCPKTSMTVKDVQDGSVQKAQLREHHYELQNITFEPKVVKNQQTKHKDSTHDSTEQFVVAKPSRRVTTIYDIDADRHSHSKPMEIKRCKLLDSTGASCESTIETYTAHTRRPDVEASLINHYMRDKPHSYVPSEIEDAVRLVSAFFVPVDSLSPKHNHRSFPGSDDDDDVGDDDNVSSSEDNSQNLETESSSSVKVNKESPNQPFKDCLTSEEREMYGDKPLPKSISMQDAGFDCYLLALSDMNYQPLTVVVDYKQVKYKADCKMCRTSYHKIPDKYSTPVNSLTEGTHHTCIDVPVEGHLPVSCQVSDQKNLTEVSLEENNISLPVGDDSNGGQLKQPASSCMNTSSQFDILAATDTPNTTPSVNIHAVEKQSSIGSLGTDSSDTEIIPSLAQCHGPRESNSPKDQSSGVRNLEDSKSDDSFRELLLEETYNAEHLLDRESVTAKKLLDTKTVSAKQLLGRKTTTGQKVVKGASNRKVKPYILNEKSSSNKGFDEVKDSIFDEETFRDNLLEEMFNVDRLVKRKDVISRQNKQKNSNLKTKTKALVGDSFDKEQRNDMINPTRNKAKNFLSVTQCNSIGISPSKYTLKAMCDQSVNEQIYPVLKSSDFNKENRNDVPDNSASVSRLEVSNPETDIHAKVSVPETSSENRLPEHDSVTTSSYPTSKDDLPLGISESQKVNADKEDLLPRVSESQKVHPVTKLTFTSDLQFAHNVTAQEKEMDNMATLTHTSVRRCEHVGTKAMPSLDMGFQEIIPHSSEDMTQKEGTINAPTFKRYHMMPDNTSFHLKKFLDKIKESVEVKKHLDEEFLIFQKEIDFLGEQTNKCPESRAQNAAVVQDTNETSTFNANYTSSIEKHSKSVTSRGDFSTEGDDVFKENTLNQKGSNSCANQSQEAINKEVDWQEASAVKSMPVACSNSQDYDVLPVSAEVGTDFHISSVRPESDMSKPETLGLSCIDSQVVANNIESLATCQFDTDYPDWSSVSVTTAGNNSYLQHSYRHVDYNNRAFTRQNAQENWTEEYSLPSTFPRDQGIHDCSSLVQYPRVCTEINRGFSQPSLSRPSVQISAPVVDPARTSYQDYRYTRSGHMPDTVPDCHVISVADEINKHATVTKSLPVANVMDAHATARMSVPVTDVKNGCAREAVSLPVVDRQNSLPAGNSNTFSCYAETVNVQRDNSNQNSPFWLASNHGITSCIPGLGFETSGTNCSSIPGLGDDVKDNLCSEIPQKIVGDETDHRAHAFDATAVWPEMYNSHQVFRNVFLEEKCRSILSSLKSYSSDKGTKTETSSCRINEDDYSDDDDLKDVDLHSLQNKQNTKSDIISRKIPDSSSDSERNDDVAYGGKSSDEIDKENHEKLRKLLFVHLSNVIRSAASTPNESSSETDTLTPSQKWQETLEKTQLRLLDGINEEITNQQEHENSDTDTCLEPRMCNSSAGNNEVPKSGCQNGVRKNSSLETFSPTAMMQSTVNTTNIRTDLQKHLPAKSCKEHHFGSISPVDVNNGNLENETHDDHSLNRSCKKQQISTNYRQDSFSSSVCVDKISKKIFSALEEFQNDFWSGSPSRTSKSPLTREADLFMKRTSNAPKKSVSSADKEIAPTLNTLIKCADKNTDINTTESADVADMNSSLELPLQCKHAGDFLRKQSGGPIVHGHRLPVKEEVQTSDSSLPGVTPPAINTTISVNSNGKIYLSDVPMSALSYAREKILSEINQLGDIINSTDLVADTEVASLPQSSDSELTSAGTGKTMFVGHSPTECDVTGKEFEEGEIKNGSESESIDEATLRNEVEVDGETSRKEDNRQLAESGSDYRTLKLVDNNDLKDENKTTVKHNACRSVMKRKTKECSSEKTMKWVSASLKQQSRDSDISYLITGSGVDSLEGVNQMTEAAVLDKVNCVDGLKKESDNCKKGSKSKTHRVFIKPSGTRKTAHKSGQQKKQPNSIKKSAVKGKKTVGVEETSESEPDYFDKISASPGDTFLPKSPFENTNKVVVKTTPGSTIVDKCGQEEEDTAGNLRKSSVFKGKIVVQVFNERSLLNGKCQHVDEMRSSMHTKWDTSDETQPDSNGSKICKNVLSDADTETTDTRFTQELDTADMFLLKANDSSTSVPTMTRKCDIQKTLFDALVEKLKCSIKNHLPAFSSGVLTDDQKLVLLEKELPLITQLVKESVRNTDIRYQGKQTSMAADITSQDVGTSRDENIDELIRNSDQCFKPGPAKRTNSNQLKYSESETDTVKMDSRPDTDTSSRSVSPYSRDIKKRRIDSSSYNRTSPYSRKRRRSRSSSPLYSRGRSWSSHSRTSRSSSQLPHDNSRRRPPHRRKEPSYSSHRGSRRSRSRSSSPNCRHRRRDTSLRYSRYKKSVSSSRSRDSSLSDDYYRHRSKSPRRYRKSDSYSTRISCAKKSDYAKRDNYSSKTKNDKLWALIKQPVNVRTKGQHPFDMLYSITNMSTQRSEGHMESHNWAYTQPESSSYVNNRNTIKHSSTSASESSFHNRIITTVGSFRDTTVPEAIGDTSSIPSLPAQTDDGRWLANVCNYQNTTNQFKDGVTDNPHREVGLQGRIPSTDRDTKMLGSPYPDHSGSMITHKVTVKKLIISQLGISITDNLSSVLPYPLHADLSDRQLSRKEQMTRCLETIQCCATHLKIPEELVSKNSIEPVINNFGNLPFEYRLQQFSNEQILLEVNVIKKCQYILEEQQTQAQPIPAAGSIQSRSQFTESKSIASGSYCGEPLPEEVQVSVHGFTFSVPKKISSENHAFNIKDSLETAIECLLGLITSSEFGREHSRVPEILLLDEEKFQLNSAGNCFLILNRPLSTKVFIHLLALKNKIEALKTDEEKSQEEKYSCSKQLIAQRASILLNYVGNITSKRLCNMKTLLNQMFDCQGYVTRVTGTEGLRKLPLFKSYVAAVNHHYKLMRDEYAKEYSS